MICWPKSTCQPLLGIPCGHVLIIVMHERQFDITYVVFPIEANHELPCMEVTFSPSWEIVGVILWMREFQFEEILCWLESLEDVCKWHKAMCCGRLVECPSWTHNKADWETTGGSIAVKKEVEQLLCLSTSIIKRYIEVITIYHIKLVTMATTMQTHRNLQKMKVTSKQAPKCKLSAWQGSQVTICTTKPYYS